MKSGIDDLREYERICGRHRRIAFATGTLLGALASLSATAGWAAECAATSGATTAALIELYTSEGCSSCPPADRWLSRIGVDGKTIPLAFHVDYWDYIGWPDRFAQARFSRRQRDLVALQRSRFVYTPQVMLGGSDFSNWAGAEFGSRLSSIQRTPAGATLSLALTTTRQTLEVLTTARTSASAAVYYLALVESGLKTEVRAGENRGSTLRHDHVVREWLGPFPLTPDGAPSAGAPRRHTIALKPDWVAANMGVVAVVQRGNGEVLQALALKLCPAA